MTTEERRRGPETLDLDTLNCEIAYLLEDLGISMNLPDLGKPATREKNRARGFKVMNVSVIALFGCKSVPYE